MPSVSLILLQVILKDSVTLKSRILLRVSEMFRVAQNRNREVVTSSSAGASTLGLLTTAQHQRVDKDKGSHGNRGGVFVVGVGNRKNDGIAYRMAGVPESCVLIIDTQAVIKIWSDSHTTTAINTPSSSGSPIAPSIDENKTQDNSGTHPGDIDITINAPPPGGGSFDTYNDARLLPYLRDRYLHHCDDQQSR